MRKTYELDRTLLLLMPTLALGLAACSSDPPVETSDEQDSETDSDSDSDDDDDDASDPSNDPSPSTPTDVDPSEGTSTTTPEPTTTDPTTETTVTTVDTDTTDTGTETTADTDTSTGEPVEELVAVWASANPPAVGNDALVGLTPALDGLAPTLKLETDVISIQSVAINTGNDAAITYDAPGGAGGVIIRENLAQNPMNGALGLGDRIITGPSTGLVTPKGVEWAGGQGLFIVADTGAQAMKVFSINDSGDVAPMFEVTDLGSSEAVWDMHYVPGNDDTLYAAGTNGEIQVYEDFLMSMGQAGPDRTIVPFSEGEKVSVNLHGITILNNRLYVTDVGDPMDAADGKLFTIPNASGADGEVDVEDLIEGGMLGNPVDLEVRSGIPSERVFVAEKANKAILVFTRPALQPLQQTSMFAIDAPESIALVGNGSVTFVARNGANLDADAALAVNLPAVGNPSVTATFDRIGSVSSIQSVALSHAGDAWVGFDGPASSGGGGVILAPGLTGMTDDATISAVGSRIWGPNTGIVAPKGLALTADLSALMVADFGAGEIKVFDANITGDTPPAFSVELGGDIPWDVAYDDPSDRLFVAVTNGNVLVFDGFLAEQGGSGPTRVISPTFDGGESINLHGIAYDAASDKLIVSDVGDAMVADDGFIFIIADASTAEDVVEVQAAIGGDQTKLGNPVDLVFDGANVYVAEKANSSVLRYDGVLDLVGLVNEPEAAAIEVVNAESVQLYYAIP